MYKPESIKVVVSYLTPLSVFPIEIHMLAIKPPQRTGNTAEDMHEHRTLQSLQQSVNCSVFSFTLSFTVAMSKASALAQGAAAVISFTGILTLLFSIGDFIHANMNSKGLVYYYLTLLVYICLFFAEVALLVSLWSLAPGIRNA